MLRSRKTAAVIAIVLMALSTAVEARCRCRARRQCRNSWVCCYPSVPLTSRPVAPAPDIGPPEAACAIRPPSQAVDFLASGQGVAEDHPSYGYPEEVWGKVFQTPPSSVTAVPTVADGWVHIGCDPLTGNFAHDRIPGGKCGQNNFLVIVEVQRAGGDILISPGTRAFDNPVSCDDEPDCPTQARPAAAASLPR
jgi:hypothetical protein